jgi:tRNA nucleotidyltransferase (CCA-adding enzyme)
VKIYSVGGAVRDDLLGLPVKDRDYVVVGATPEDMERLGYRPVGKDFPVFLHPETHEEYALARTERKVARGYKGFTVHAAPDVTLEQDLERRDLTINAMARDEHGALIDPHGGERDLKAKRLRHVGAAFVEDPVRILRVARFAARFGFAIAPETLALMRRMVAEGEADALVAERVWQEFAKGLMEAAPQRMFEALAACGLLPKLLPELDLAMGEDGAPANKATQGLMHGLLFAAREEKSLEVRFALLAFALKSVDEKSARSLADRLRAPNECRDALLLAARHGASLRALTGTDAAAQLALLEAGDAFRRPERLRTLVDACECADGGDQGGAPSAPRLVIERALLAASGIDAAKIAAGATGAGDGVAAAIRAARLERIRAVLGQA